MAKGALSPLKKYYDAVQNLTSAFISKYYTEPEWFWVGNQIGGVLFVNDHYFDMAAIVNVMRLCPKLKDFHEWYFKRMEAIDKKETPLTLEAFLKLK